MFVLDVILYKLFCIFCPETKADVQSSKNAESSENWIILDDLYKDGKLHDREDPYFSEGNDNGPEW